MLIAIAIAFSVADCGTPPNVWRFLAVINIKSELGKLGAAHTRTAARRCLENLDFFTRPDPALLLLDEPFAGLDPAVSALLEQTLRSLHAGGATIIFSSHDLEGGLRIAHRAVTMFGGRIAWDSGTSRPSIDDARDAYERTSVRD